MPADVSATVAIAALLVAIVALAGVLLLAWRMRRGRRKRGSVDTTDLGPAVYLDAAKYAARRSQDGPTPSRLLYEVFYAYFLPQFEGFDDLRATKLYRTIEGLFDPPEQAEVQRTMGEVLGVELAL